MRTSWRELGPLLAYKYHSSSSPRPLFPLLETKIPAPPPLPLLATFLALRLILTKSPLRRGICLVCWMPRGFLFPGSPCLQVGSRNCNGCACIPRYMRSSLAHSGTRCTSPRGGDPPQNIGRSGISEGFRDLLSPGRGNTHRRALGRLGVLGRRRRSLGRLPSLGRRRRSRRGRGS